MKRITYWKEALIKKNFDSVLSRFSVSPFVKKHVIDGLVQTSLRGVDSHGIRLFPHYVSALEHGRINGRPRYQFKMNFPAAGVMDADHTFGHAAGAHAMEKAVSLARKLGVGAIAVKNSSHFGAAAYYSLIAAEKGMIGISMTHADSLMLTHNAKNPYFGTNPIAFAAPCSGEAPFCLDMATTIFTWNKIKQYRAGGKKLPPGIGADAFGCSTTDLSKVACLFPVGAYKGFGLSMAVEILCSLLTGMPFGKHISSMYKAPIEEKRFLGHFFLAINIAAFEDPTKFKKRLKQMVFEVRSQPKKNAKNPVMVSGDPEKLAYAKRKIAGIPVDRHDRALFVQLEERFQIKFP